MVELYNQRLVSENDLSNHTSVKQIKLRENKIKQFGILGSHVGENEELNSYGLRRHVQW
jgi:hypothetical protein